MANVRLYLAALFHSIFGFSSCFYMSVLNPVEPYVKQLLNDSISQTYNHTLVKSELEWLWSLVSSSIMIGQFVGFAILTFPAEKFGRRDTVMVLKNLILVVSGLMLFAAKPLNSIELFLVGRFLAGVAIAFTMFICVFMAECAPLSSRCLASIIPNAVGQRLWVALGTLTTLPWLMGTSGHWHYSLLVPLPPALLHLLATPYVRKSPRYLFLSRKEYVASDKSVRFYQGSVDLSPVHEELLAEERLCASSSASLWSVLTTRHLRWPLLLSCGVCVAASLGGFDIALQYSTGIMQSLGLDHSMASLYSFLFLTLPCFLLALISMFLADHFGRRALFLPGYGLMIVGLGLLTLTTPFEGASAVLSVAGLSMIMLGFGLGPGIMGPMLPGEICPQISRSVTSGASLGADMTAAVAILFLYPPLNAAYGSYCLLPLVALGVISLILLAIYLPESKDRTVHEIVQRWID